MNKIDVTSVRCVHTDYLKGIGILKEHFKILFQKVYFKYYFKRFSHHFKSFFFIKIF
jgi:hypothetical protein